jgi:flagellar hook-associated protein 2
MGTVGLSFGSPTSGAGFDVATTVSTIVANLEKVETPWKTQLTSLESQDTVLSNLGTLLSNLSTDVSQLTDFTGVLAQKTGSSSDNNVLQLTNATSAAVAGTHTVVVNSLAHTESGILTTITNSSDKLSGSITIQVGAGKAHTITLGSSNNTLQGLANAINTAGSGVTASVLTDSTGSRLSLVSGTSGGNGNLTISSAIVDQTNSNAPLTYKQLVQGVDASLTIDGADLHSASNTVTNLINGVTFQLLSPSSTQSDGQTLEPIQVVIGNDNSGAESAIIQMVSDYNALIKAVNAQQGKDGSGNPEPLFGSPTLSLLQQQLLSSVNVQNPNGYLGAITVNASTALSGSMSLQVGNGKTETLVIGAATDPPAEDTIYTGAGVDTLQGVADAINAAKIGVTAGVTTQFGQSMLSLLSNTAGSAGALGVASSLTSTSNKLLGFSAFFAMGTADSGGVLDAAQSGSDALSGSFSIQVGNGAAQTVTIDPAHNTLQDVADAINGNSGIGVSASVVTNSDGSAYLSVQSQTPGRAGNLTLTSNILDTAVSTSTDVTYTNSSDISTLANLGIATSQNYDGSLTFDGSVLDAALNADFNGVLGFFQNMNSWGQSFAKMLGNAGTSSPTGLLSLAQTANSSMESNLNAELSKEDSVISAQQKKLTAELTQANEIMQQLPSQLEGMNMLYSAITGYNSNRG